MQIVRIFLSSSSELKEDRQEFEILIARENKVLLSRGVFLELVVWEDFIESMSQTRLQDEYKKTILNSDIFVMLFCTRVGQYIEEEFETAFKHFKSTNRPFIFMYFKDIEISTEMANKQDLMSLWAFQEKLTALGYFYSTYNNIDELKSNFNQQLDKLLVLDTFKENHGEGTFKYKKHKVFISYSHRDQPFLDRLLVHLKPLCGEGLIEIWDDTKLKPGDDWKKEIDKNLRETGFAILLVSADFLASDFILKNELPPLLMAAEKRGTRITPIIIKPCRFTRDKQLSIYQAVNSPTKPLSGEDENNQEKIFDKVAEWIEVYLTSDNAPNS